MFSIQPAATHEQPGTSRAVCVMERKRAREAERECERVFIPSLAMNLTCFPDLIYVNSTCKLWDKAFNTSYSNFYGSPALKIFFFLEITLVFFFSCLIFMLCTGGDFAKLSFRLSDFPQLYFILKWKQSFSHNQQQWKHLTFSYIAHLIFIRHDCHHCPVA